VADADDGEVLRLGIHADFAEVAFDALPSAASGDGHAFVVVPGGAAGGECIAQPEGVLGRDRIGDVREGRRAFVCGDDEIGVIAVATNYALRRGDAVVDDVVGDVQ